jgi:hypothetical protein
MHNMIGKVPNFVTPERCCGARRPKSAYDYDNSRCRRFVRPQAGSQAKATTTTQWDCVYDGNGDVLICVEGSGAWVCGVVKYLFNAAAHDRETKISLNGRYAAGLGDAACTPGCIHLAIVVQDQYSGVTLIDGQPGFGVSLDSALLTLHSNVLSDFQKNTVFTVDITVPSGMSGRQFAAALLEGAQNFKAGVVGYSIPDLPSGEMGRGQYNSNAYVSGLIKSVSGFVPTVSFGNLQAPGWANPIQAYRFKKN